MQKDFNSWNVRKQVIHSSDREKEFYIHEREIWWCSLGINVGDEEDGKNDLFERPVLVLKKFNRSIVLVVPLTTKIKQNRYYFPFIYDDMGFAVILSQLRLVSTKRFTRRLRKIDSGLFQVIRRQLIDTVLS